VAARRADQVTIGGAVVRPGRRRHVDVPVARLPTGTWISLPLDVLNGREPGDTLWLSAALHGDELNGIEIIRRALARIDPRELRGTVIAAPIVNVFGLIHGSRYLPDRRDLNRSFPGSRTGSMAARLAHLFMEEVVNRSRYGIDLHTGSDGRMNLPQVRADLDRPEGRRLAEAFGAPVMIHAPERKGSLRHAASRSGIANVLYEAGEAHRFDRQGIAVGVRGVLRVLQTVGMLPGTEQCAAPSRESRRTTWLRAGRGGILHLDADLGDCVARGDVLGGIYDPAGSRHYPVRARTAGMIVGIEREPLVNRGDAIVRVAELLPPGA
jgi:predicted deacylase